MFVESMVCMSALSMYENKSEHRFFFFAKKISLRTLSRKFIDGIMHLIVTCVCAFGENSLSTLQNVEITVQ